MTSKKILVMFGATGNRRGSVINSILSDPITAEQFQIVGITRDPSMPSAVVLAGKGGKLIKADLEDKECLPLPLKDAYAVFAVTNWQELLNKEKEIQQGGNVADVTKELKIQHFIWSSLPDVTKISNETITGVLHFDSKAVVEECIRSLGIPASFLLQGIFMNQIFQFLLPFTSPSGSKSYKFTVPVPSNTKMPLISVNKDTGKYVKAMLRHPEKFSVRGFIRERNAIPWSRRRRFLREWGAWMWSMSSVRTRLLGRVWLVWELLSFCKRM